MSKPIYGNVKNQNYEGLENPQESQGKRMHLKGISIWCGSWLVGKGLFFHTEVGNVFTFKGEKYRNLLDELL